MAHAYGAQHASGAPLASSGDLSPHISCYFWSLWYPSGAEPGLALGTGKGSSSLELQVAGEEQKKTPREGIRARTLHDVRRLESQVGCDGPEGRGLAKAAAFPGSSKRCSLLPPPSAVKKFILPTPLGNSAPSLVEPYTCKS